MQSRIMYIELKGDGIAGPARIGKVTFSRSGQSVYYGGRRFSRLGGRGFKANYFDTETLQYYWISGCKKNGQDALYSTTIEIDDNVCEEYWVEIRNRPEMKHVRTIRSTGKYSR